MSKRVRTEDIAAAIINANDILSMGAQRVEGAGGLN
jgi:hypothetical protein